MIATSSNGTAWLFASGGLLPNLATAIEGASRSRQDVVLRGPIDLGLAQVATLAGDLRIILEPGTKINYSGRQHIDRLLTLVCAGHRLEIVGNGSIIDCRNRANRGLVIYNQEDSVPDAQLSGLTIQNCRMLAGNNLNVGAGAIVVQGSFNRCRISDVAFLAITRQAGAGLSSSYGSAGLHIVPSGSGQRARHIHISNVTGVDIGTDDAKGSAARVDCDLLIVDQGGFANEAKGDSCKIENITANEVLGRGVKCIASCVPIIDDVGFILSKTGITGNSSAVNCQLGVGIVTNVTSILRGEAMSATSNHSAVNFYTNVSRKTSAGSIFVGDLTVDCQVEGPTRCNDMVGVENASPTDVTPKVAVLRNLTAIGQPVAAIVSIGNNGISKNGIRDSFVLNIEGFQGALTRCVIRSGGTPSNMKATLRKLRNSASAVVTVRRDDDALRGQILGQIVNAGGNLGIR